MPTAIDGLVNKATWLVLVVVLASAFAQAAHAQDSVASSGPTTHLGDEQRAVGNALWVTGLSVLAASWGLTGIASTTLVKVANARDVTIYESWIPVVGPWIMLGDSRGFDDTQLALTITSALVQTLACAALIVGLVLENDAPRDPTVARVWIAPTLGSGTAGIGAFGTF